MLQAIPNPVQHLFVEGELTQDLPKPLLEDFLPNVGFRAFPLVARAVIVDVLPLLDISNHGATAVAALDQARESKIVLGSAMALSMAAVQDVLHLVPELTRNDRLVGTLVDATVPVEFAHVDALAKDLVYRAERERVAAPAKR